MTDSDATTAGNETGRQDLDDVRARRVGAPLHAAVLSVGSELLLGDLTDTNAVWLSTKLRELGIEVHHHLSVRDDLDEVVDGLRWLARRAQVVIVGGGLGPTNDDLTRDAIARAADVPLEHRDELEAAIRARFDRQNRTMTALNLRQAKVPMGADVFEPVGTAPGFAVTLTDPAPTRVAALPGVPWELKEMFLRHVAPELQALGGHRATLTRVIHVVGRGESDIAAVLEPIAEDQDIAELSFLARDHEVQVRLTTSGDDADAARAAAQPLLEAMVDELGAAVAGIDEETLEDVVLRLLGDRGHTVATAESATGDDIAGRLAKVPGASLGLVGGMVVYETDTKSDVLGVPREVLDEHGPVSAEVTVELARLARERFGADWGIGVTGCAGPTEQNGKPVGTVYWALANPAGEVEVHERVLAGDRVQIIARLGTAAIDLLRRRLLASG